MKPAEFRATHGNPQGSDHLFEPTDNGMGILNEAWNVVKGLARGRNVDALRAKEVDPRNPNTRHKMLEAHDTNQWLLGEGPYDTRMTVVDKVPNRKKKKKRGGNFNNPGPQGGH